MATGEALAREVDHAIDDLTKVARPGTRASRRLALARAHRLDAYGARPRSTTYEVRLQNALRQALTGLDSVQAEVAADA